MYDLDAYLNAHIPITRAMGITLQRYDAGQLTLSAPLEPNVNDKGTAFAGSLATLVTLCGWSYTHVSLADAGCSADVMVAKSETRYLKPAGGGLQATCKGPDAATRSRFFEAFAERGKARWTLSVELHSRGELTVRYEGDYVAVRKNERSLKPA